MATHKVRTTFHPDKEITVEDSEYEYLKSSKLLASESEKSADEEDEEDESSTSSKSKKAPDSKKGNDK